MKKRFTDFRFFSRFLYIPLNDKVLCVLLGGRQALTRQRTCEGSVGAAGGKTSPDEAAGAKPLWALWAAGGI